MFNLGSSYFHVALTIVRHLLNVTVSLDHALPRCTVAVEIHCMLDLCSGYSRCCIGALTPLLRRLGLGLEKLVSLAYITA